MSKYSEVKQAGSSLCVWHHVLGPAQHIQGEGPVIGHTLYGRHSKSLGLRKWIWGESGTKLLTCSVKQLGQEKQADMGEGVRVRGVCGHRICTDTDQTFCTALILYSSNSNAERQTVWFRQDQQTCTRIFSHWVTDRQTFTEIQHMAYRHARMHTNIDYIHRQTFR